MGEIHQYHVTMLITREQEDAIRSVFHEKHWPYSLQVLSDETVLDIIQSGFTDVFPKLNVDLNDNTGPSSFKEIKSEVVSVETERDSGSESSDTIELENIKDLEDVEKEDEEIHSEGIQEESDGTQKFFARTVTRRSSRRSTNRKGSTAKRSIANSDSRASQKRGRNVEESKKRRSHYTLQCVDCKLKFSSREELWKHRNEVKHPLPTENISTKFNLGLYSVEEYVQMGFVKCDGCDNYFLGKRRQMKHFYVVHRDLMPTPTCPICCAEFETYAELLKHKREEGHRDSVSSLNNYQCDLCGKHMTSYSNFVQHKQFVCGIDEKEMEKIRIHKCDLCAKLFKSPRHVRRHRKISHFKSPEVCDICGTVCQGRKALEVHKKRHDEKNKTHVCSDCGKAFFSGSKLQEHIRTHTKEKPFKCPLCTYTCAVKPNIQKHAINVHRQAVVAVDLRKTPSDDEPNNVSDTDLNRNVQGNIKEFSNNEMIQNAIAGQELNRKAEENRQTAFEHESNTSTYISNELDPKTGILGKDAASIDQTYMPVPMAYSDNELNIVDQHNIISAENHKTITNAYIDNDLNRNLPAQFQDSQIVYYNEQERARAEYIVYPHNHLNFNQYQTHMN